MPSLESRRAPLRAPSGSPVLRLPLCSQLPARFTLSLRGTFPEMMQNPVERLEHTLKAVSREAEQKTKKRKIGNGKENQGIVPGALPPN